jgi:predicted nucleic acid-binding protein
LIEAAIVDASVGIKWVVNETESEFARLLSACDLLAPDLFPIECSNILWKKVRIRDLTRRDALDYLDLLRQSPVAIVPTHDLTAKALELAMDLQHPVYDCVYLALALRRGAPLVTADQRLVTAAAKFRKTKGLIISLSDIPNYLRSN